MISGIDRNIKLYPLYRIAADAHAWIPIFFLYFSQRLSMAEVILLESVYYIAVVAIEVPSGYFSDRLGRRKTLLISTIATVGAYALFLSADAFAGLACGQIIMAFANAFRSGTDTSLLFESLSVVNREDEYGDREAKAGQYGFLSTALAALAGGVLGSMNLSWPYWLSMLTAIASIAIVWMFVEPLSRASSSPQGGFVEQLSQCAGYMFRPLLGWLFVYYVYMYTIVHIPFEFYQPYLALLDDRGMLGSYSAPLIAGIIFAITAFVGSFAARFSMDLRRSLGLISLLSWAAILEVVVIAALALFLHPVLAALVILRNGPMAVITAPINATIAPQVEDAHRATYLSLRSLVARLAFAGLLAGLSWLIPGHDAIQWEALSFVLRIGLLVGVIGIVLLLLFARRLANTPSLKDEFYS